MAAEVRSWVLEMGAKREQQQQRVPDSSVSGADARGYFLLGRTRKVRQGVLGSSGPVAFVEVLCDGDSSTEGPETESDSRARLINILLFGMPRSQPGQVAGNNGIPDLRPDGLVGIHKGLVWEIELDGEKPGSSGSDKEKWLVCMEWDLIQ
ncbi:hypothetical protein PHISP_05510 [Aspergillus sp. HF37]|nr:hypothetical protein PHISP_05510 [Aspergillus sp. HF37]